MNTPVTALPFTLGTPGSGLSSEVPGKYAVAVDGRGFLVDLTANPGFSLVPIPLLRNQADTGERPSERSLNPAGLWRRSGESWHLGAGQDHHDWDESTPYRFRTSKGVYVWERLQLSLLAATVNKGSSANTNLALAVAGARLYRINGAALEYTTDITVASPTWTAVTGLPGSAASAIVSDGHNVYTAHGTDGIYRTTRLSASSASYITGSVTGLGWAKDRLMASATNSIYNITAALPGPAALPAALYSHNNSDFSWVGFTEGPNRIYAAGYSGDKSQVYRLGLKADGTGLDAAIAATPGLMDGEVVRSIANYIGFVLLGTDKGLRFCSTDANGDLTLGALIEGGAVRCFEGQDRFVWYGSDNYDAASTGLGRLDLSTVGNPDLAPLTPAYASDLMATGQGQVTSVVTFQNRRVFTVSGLGVFVESDDKVTSGTIDSGVITYGLGDPKIALFVDVRHLPLAGTVTPALSSDAGDFASLGASRDALSASSTVSANQVRGEQFELRLTLDRSTSSTTTGPTLTRWTLRSQPDPDRVWVYTVPLLLSERIDTRSQTEEYRPAASDLDFLAARLGRVVTLQLPDRAVTAILEDLSWNPTHETTDATSWDAVCTVQLKTLQ